jgi:hypothetical protein
MKKKLAEAKKSGQNLFPSGFLPHKDKFADDLNDFDYGSDDENTQDADECIEPGPKTLQLLALAKDMKHIMQAKGWLDACLDGIPHVDKDHLMLEFKPRIE